MAYVPTQDDKVNQISAMIDGADDPDNQAKAIQAAAQKYRLPVPLLAAIAHTESNGHFAAISDAGAKGTMQIMDSNTKPTGINPFSLDSIDLGAKMLRQSLDNNGGDINTALREYQGGPNRAKWGANNAAYPGQVLANYNSYKGDPQAISARALLAPAGSPQTQAPVPVAPPSQTGTPAKGMSTDDITKMLDEGFAPAEENQTPSAPKPAGVAPSPTPNAPQVAPVPAAQFAAQTQTQAQGPISPPGYTPSELASNALQGQSAPSPPNIGPAQLPNWDMGTQLLNGMTLGHAPQVLATVNGLTGQPGTYDQRVAAAQQAQTQFSTAHPFMAAGSDILGSVPTSMAGGSFMGTGAKLLGAGISEAVPALEGAVNGVGNFLQGAVNTGSKVGNYVLNRLGDATKGALEGGTFGAAQGGLDQGSTQGDVKTGAELGAGVNALTGALGAPTWRLLSNAAIDPAVAQLALGAQKLGINLRGTQLATDNMVRGLDRRVVSSDANAQQLQDYTSAAAKTIGADSKTLSVGDWQDAKDKIGNSMDQIAAKTTINNTPALQQALAQVDALATKNLLADSPERATVSHMIQVLQDGLATGAMNGGEYQSLTNYASTYAQLMRNPSTAYYGTMIRGALDQAVADSSPPDVLPAWQQARKQWDLAQRLEPAVNAAGSTGILDPKMVARAWAGTDGDAGTLAQVGRLDSIPRPNSVGGSGARVDPIREGLNLTKTAMLLGATGAGGLGGDFAGGGTGALMGGLGIPAGFLAAQKGLQSVVESPRFTKMLLQNALTGNTFRTQNPLIPAAVGVGNFTGAGPNGSNTNGQ